jgi:hypothetical protein
MYNIWQEVTELSKNSAMEINNLSLHMFHFHCLLIEAHNNMNLHTAFDYCHIDL